jgi:hypothetical protein
MEIKGREFEMYWIVLSREKGPLRTSFQYGNTALSFEEGGEFLENRLEILKKDSCTI